jgi:phage gpG-like protein
MILEISTIDALAPTLRRVKEAALDLADPMADLSAEFLVDHLARFNAQRDPEGVPWKPSQEAIDQGRPTLRKSGDLYNAIDRDSGADFAAVGVYATGGPAVYARGHQDGATIRAKVGKALRTPFGPRASVRLPRRSYIGFTGENIELTDRVLIAHLDRAANGAGV